MKPTQVAVLFSPFQVVDIPSAHDALIQNLLKYDLLIFAILVRRVCPTKKAPLNFLTRRDMILTKYPQGNVMVIAVPEERYPQRQVAVLDAAIKAVFSERPSVVVYTDEKFCKYAKSGGMFTESSTTFLMDAEEENRKNWKCIYPNLNVDDLDPKLTYRAGCVSTILSQYPISWGTIDMAIMRKIGKKTMLLLGKKPGEIGWRFPGGFKDRTDVCFEDAVYREGGEEVLKKGVDPKKALSFPRYICSQNINDWRYAGEPDGITTMFFATEFVGQEADILAGDDLAQAQWFNVADLEPEMFEGEHQILFEKLKESIK